MVTTEEASDILWKHWGIAAVQVETPTSRNVHFVHSVQGNSVLRTNPGWDGPSPPELIVRFVDHLSSSGSPVPKIVPTLNGEQSDHFFIYISSAEEQTPMEKFIVSDGAEIAYVDEGTPSLGTIVFVHGGPGSHSAYLGGFASSIKDDFRILLYDQRGSGLSSRTVKESSITINRYVEDLYELLRDRKAVDVILLGHSFGGVVVLEYVLTHPDGVQGVILENGMADARISMDDRVKGAFDLCQRVSLPEVENVVRKYQEGHALSFSEFSDKLAGDELQEELYWYDADAEGLGFPDWYKRWGYTDKVTSEVEWICRRFWDQGLLTTYSVLDRLHQIEKPTLVVTGRHDQVISPRHAEEVARRLPQSQLRILEQSGHYPHIEEPQEFRRIVYEFVESQ